MKSMLKYLRQKSREKNNKSLKMGTDLPKMPQTTNIIMLKYKKSFLVLLNPWLTIDFFCMLFFSWLIWHWALVVNGNEEVDDDRFIFMLRKKIQIRWINACVCLSINDSDAISLDIYYYEWCSGSGCHGCYSHIFSCEALLTLW